jgi:hypothetical protein
VARRRGAGRPATPRKTIGILRLCFDGLFSAKKERKIILSIKNFGTGRFRIPAKNNGTMTDIHI